MKFISKKELVQKVNQMEGNWLMQFHLNNSCYNGGGADKAVIMAKSCLITFSNTCMSTDCFVLLNISQNWLKKCRR